MYTDGKNNQIKPKEEEGPPGCINIHIILMF
jgi:hypothetical protein